MRLGRRQPAAPERRDAQTAAPADAIHVDRASCSFGRRRALDDLTLTVPRGDVLGIVGPNGVGKTTLIELLCGLFRPTSGRITVLGHDVSRQPRAVRRRIGVVPRETALYKEVSARQNLRFAAALYAAPNSRARISAVLELVGLTARGDDVVRTFSGGMQRRLALARALLHEPELLILDEPTVGVDADARHQIWAHIRAPRAQGRTVLLTTNYLDEAEALCDRVAILREGRLLAIETPAALLRRAGRCLELRCATAALPALAGFLDENPAVLRVVPADDGFTAYLSGLTTPEDVARQAMALVPLASFRARSPDLVEIFRTLALDSVA